MEQGLASERATARRVMRAGLLISIGYWTALLCVLSALAVLDGWEMWGTFAARAINTVVAVLISAVIAKLVVGSRKSSFAAKCVLVLVLTLIGSTIYFFATFEIFRLFGGNQTPLMLNDALRLISYWFAQFLGWSALLLALLYHHEVQDRERQLSSLREQAYGAQMRALRYQINPHFLFNTLNALAGLIEERELPNAERMVLSLSAFLRSTLALDPLQDITLADELDIQARYLEIERERFSDRLSTRFDVPDDLRCAMVPSLILQPLVENAVKHGVSSLDRCVQVRIAAEATDGTLSVHVENDAPPEERRTEGTGVGLRNVAERLRARFGETGRLVSVKSDGIFRSTVTMPLRCAQ
ncbi:histidine kinase [Sphingomonas sp. ID1715]|uniref:sensor histidine kinase n=1 Tax=Sphingomonas sp. ID1715 TaxID=1656898 RepID=UPI00148A0A6B|nr:histidine kinase [Sphingomonas sp. ID1715]NNM76238.1 histidine kinase [Sphingomonas sp. ID1715]